MRVKLGIDVGENQADPREFVECGVLAEALGFDTYWLGDHFMPWIHTGGKSAYVWSVMAALLERTDRILVGPDVTTPIGARYHPVVIAQAAATLDNMYPGRFLLGVGSGEAMNEEPFFQAAGMGWPKWKERIERLVEGVELIRRTWSSPDYFSFEGRFFKMRNICLYTKPRTKIPIYFSAMGPKAATYAGRFGDALITISTPSRCKDIIFPRFEEGARIAGKNPASMEKMAFVCFGIGEQSSLIQRLKGGDAAFLADKAFEEPDPRRVEAMAATVEDDRIRKNFQLCRSADDLVPVVESYVSEGANQVVFSTGASPELIKQIGERVIPSFR